MQLRNACTALDAETVWFTVLFTMPLEMNSDLTTILEEEALQCPGLLKMMRHALIRDFSCVHYVVYETTNVAGCDSVVTLDLTVNKQATVELTYPIEFCADGSQEYRGVVYTEAGSFPLDLIEGTISDTLITVVVTVHEKMLTNEYVEDSVGHVIELPEGEWYLGEELLEASTYELQVADTAGLEFVQYGETEKGCESVAKIIVTVLYEEETVDPGQTTALERVKAQTEAVKEFRNGVLYIRRGERLFTAEGREVK